MQSAKQLDRAINDFRKNAFDGGFFNNDDQLNEIIKKETLDDPSAPLLAKLLCSMGKKGGLGIATVARVWEFQDRIREYQKSNNISSVLWREVDWLGEKIRFPITSSDLDFMPQDGPILTRWKNPTVDKFVDFIRRHEMESLLVKSVWINDEEMEFSVSLDDVYNYAKNYATAWLTWGIESPVYLARESDRPNIIEMTKEILYYSSDYGIFLEQLPTPDNPDPESAHFFVEIRRQP